MSDFAVIFDLDGVLFDTERLCLRCWHEASSGWGLKDLTETFYRCVGCTKPKTRSILLSAYGDDFPMDEFDARVRALCHAHMEQNGVPVKPGAEEILRFLRQNAVPCAIGSSTRTETVRSELAAAGLSDYFAAVVGGDRAARSKPEPDIFLAAASALSFFPPSCYVVEDSHNGIRAASAAGMHPLMVPDLLPPTDEVRALAEAVLPSLADAQEYLAARL